VISIRGGCCNERTLLRIGRPLRLARNPTGIGTKAKIRAYWRSNAIQYRPNSYAVATEQQVERDKKARIRELMRRGINQPTLLACSIRVSDRQSVCEPWRTMKSPSLSAPHESPTNCNLRRQDDRGVAFNRSCPTGDAE